MASPSAGTSSCCRRAPACTQRGYQFLLQVENDVVPVAEHWLQKLLIGAQAQLQACPCMHTGGMSVGILVERFIHIEMDA